jgi:hypothetical protein
MDSYPEGTWHKNGQKYGLDQRNYGNMPAFIKSGMVSWLGRLAISGHFGFPG